VHRKSSVTDESLPIQRWSFALPEVLELVGIRRLSGKVVIASRTDQFSLFVDSGAVVAATSSLRSLRLGHLLLQRSAIEPLYLYDVLIGRRSVSRSRALGGTLVAEGAITRTALLATVEEQVTEVMSRALSVPSPTVYVIADEPLPDGIERAPFAYDTLLAEADISATRRSQANAMQRLLPKPDQLLRVLAPLGVHSRSLSDRELLVALQIDLGGATLNRLGSLLPLEPIDLKRIVISLLERELIARA